MTYEIHLYGGPRDGEEILSPRPYDQLKFPDGLYRAECEGQACMVWAADHIRRIDLVYRE